MELEELQEQWEQAKKSASSKNSGAAEMEAQIRRHNRFQLNQHLLNTLILLVTWGVLLYFYNVVASMQTVLGQVGSFLLIFSLGVRIALEIGSFGYFRKIQPTLSTLDKEHKMMSYYRFRKKLHDVWSPVIVMIYLIGVGLQVPEFLEYFSAKRISLWLGLFLASGLLIFWGARKGIKKEMDALRAVIRLKDL